MSFSLRSLSLQLPHEVRFLGKSHSFCSLKCDLSRKRNTSVSLASLRAVVIDQFGKMLVNYPSLILVGEQLGEKKASLATI